MDGQKGDDGPTYLDKLNMKRNVWQTDEPTYEVILATAWQKGDDMPTYLYLGETRKCDRWTEKKAKWRHMDSDSDQFLLLLFNKLTRHK